MLVEPRSGAWPIVAEGTRGAAVAVPIHIHGHTVALQPTGVRRGTIKVLPRETIAFDLIADNLGQRMLHCHNTYHLVRGMAVDVRYTT